MARSNARLGAVLASLLFVVAACGGSSASAGPTTAPLATAGSSPPVGTGGGAPSSSAAAASSKPGGVAAGPPSHVCDLFTDAEMTALTGGSITKTDPFVHATFPQCVWSFKDAAKVGTAVTTVLVAFAPATLFDHNNTAGRVDVSGVGDAAYAYPPGQSALKSSGAELWVRTKGLVMRIYSVPVDFEILKDATKTKAWTSQSLALNDAVAKQVIARL